MVGVTGLKTTSDIDQQALWDEIKRLTLEAVAADPAYTFKKLFVRPVSSPKVRVPRESYLNPIAIEDGATPDYAKLIGDYTNKDIVVKEYALATGITRNTIEDSDEDEIRWHAARALKAMKVNQENIVIASVDATPLDGSVPTADIPPPYGSETFLNTHDHILGGGLTTANIDSCIALINEHGHTADYLLCHPANVQDVLTLIISVDVTGSTDMSNAGFFDEPGYLDGIAAVKRIRGLKIMTNAWVTKDRYYIGASAVKPIAWYEKRPITVEQDPRAGFGIAGTWYSNRFGVVLVYPTAFAIITA